MAYKELQTGKEAEKKLWEAAIKKQGPLSVAGEAETVKPKGR